MSKFDSEAEMLESLIPWLEQRGWEVYKEVESPNGFTDIVAKKDGYLWGIEGKMACNEAVILQAENNLDVYHINSIAVPRSPNSIYKFYLEQKGIGCLVIERDKYLTAEVGLPARITLEHVPEMNENPKYHDSVMLHESMKEARAGTTGETRITKYKVTVMNVQEYLNKSGPASLQQILDNVEMHWSDNRKKYNLKAMLLDWESHKFERKWSIDRGEHVFISKL